MTARRGQPGFLLLEDGTLFRGSLLRSRATPTVAEVVFTTNMSGYQEVFTDPSYRGQIVVMTAPMIGNYGVNAEDPESAQPQIAGVVVRELSRTLLELARRRRSRSPGSSAAQVPALEDVDTRRLTRHLRTRRRHARRRSRAATQPTREALARARCVSVDGRARPRVASSRRRSRTTWGEPDAPYHIVAYDFGIKRNILRLFAEHGCRVTVVPAKTSADEALAARAGRRVSLERAGRSGGGGLRAGHGAGDRRRRRADFRHLPGASDLGAHLRRAHGEDAVRTSRRKSSGEGARDRDVS